MGLNHALVQFAVVAGVLTLTPGLDTALVLRQALGGSRTAGLLTALGIAGGCLAWGVAAAVGVSALVTASPVAFTVVRLLGALYLLFLAGQMLWAAARPSPDAAHGAAGPATNGRGAFTRGLLTNLLNPKIGVFYVAVLPQFLPPGHSPALVGSLLAGVHAVETVLWLGTVTLAAHALRRHLTSPRTARTIDAVTGTVLLAFGAHLVLDVIG